SEGEWRSCLSGDLGARCARRGSGRRRRRLPAEAARSSSVRLDRQGPARDERPRAGRDAAMNDRLSSGEPHLDEVLGGGLPADAINMLVGLPGTGKTILAQQYVFANATPERPAVYLSTVSEPFDKILRYGQTLGFFDPKAVGRSVFYDDLG